jgi:hypothetical protein
LLSISTCAATTWHKQPVGTFARADAPARLRSSFPTSSAALGASDVQSAAHHAKYHAGKEKDRRELENPEHERGYHNPKVFRWSPPAPDTGTGTGTAEAGTSLHCLFSWPGTLS